MSPSRLVLGIDGGGTKSIAWLAETRADDEPRILGRGGGGPSNAQAIGLEAALENLDEAIDAAFREAGRPRETVAAAVLALAGSDRDSVRCPVEAWARDRQLAQHVRVVHDALPLLAAGTNDGWGIALISGTGSYCFGQTADGRSTRAGGWGYLLGDEGSGFALAVAALRASVKAHDGRGPATQLLPAFLKRLHLEDATQLIPTLHAMANQPAKIAALADLVLTAAEQGDTVAGRIVTDAADELALMVEAVAQALQLDTGSFPLVLAGGVLCRGQMLSTQLAAQLKSRGIQPQSVKFVPIPACGAVRLATRLGRPVG